MTSVDGCATLYEAFVSSVEKYADRPALGKRVGDGVVNGLDLYVLAASQFRLGPYYDLGTPHELRNVPTVEGRDETISRCTDLDPYTRLEWQQRISYDACFAPSEEADFCALEMWNTTDRCLAASYSGRRLDEDDDEDGDEDGNEEVDDCLLYTSPSPRD